MDTGVFFVVHVWRDVRGFHATARDVMHEHDEEFDSPEELMRFLAAHAAAPPVYGDDTK